MTVLFPKIHWSSIAILSPQERNMKSKSSETLQSVPGWIRREHDFAHKWIKKDSLAKCIYRLHPWVSIQSLSEPAKHVHPPPQKCNLFLSTKQRSSLQIWRSNWEDYFRLTANVTGFWLKSLCVFICTYLHISNLLAYSPALQPSLRKMQQQK